MRTNEEIDKLLDEVFLSARSDVSFLYYARGFANRYTRSETRLDGFRVSVSYSNSDMRHAKLNWEVIPPGLDIYIANPKDENPDGVLAERAFVAIHIAKLVLLDIPSLLSPDDKNEKQISFNSSDEKKQAITYSAQEILKTSARMNHGSLLRKKYTLTVERIDKWFQDFNSQNKLGVLSVGTKNKVKKILHDVFPFIKDGADCTAGILECDIRAVEWYLRSQVKPTLYKMFAKYKPLQDNVHSNMDDDIKTLEAYVHELRVQDKMVRENIRKIFMKYEPIDGNIDSHTQDIASLERIITKISVMPPTPGTSGSKIKGRLPISNNAATIQYQHVDDIREILPATHKSQAFAFARHIVAHELTHALLHDPLKPAELSPAEKEVVEMEVAITARKLLERREGLYNGECSGRDYIESCNAIKAVVRYFYREQEGKPNGFLNKVLSD